MRSASSPLVELRTCVPCQNQLGEGIQWDAVRQVFRWCDIEGGTIHHYDPEADSLVEWQIDERVSYAASVNNHDRLLAVLANGLAWFDLASSQLERFKQVDLPQPGMRLNDARVDRQRRLWFGSMHETSTQSPQGTLFRLDADLSLTEHASELHIANGISWSTDSSKIFLADSPTGLIRQARFDANTGGTSNWSRWHVSEHGSPDGATVDAENHMWSCQWGSSEIVRLDTHGQVVLRLSLPVSQPSCPAFGGRALNLLAITSAQVGLSESARQQQSAAGSVLIFETPWRGLEEPSFQLA